MNNAGPSTGGSKDSESPKTPISRASKACEHCRTRRIKCEECDPPPCKACRAAGLRDCSVRSKARPGRPSKAAEVGGTINRTSHSERTRGLYHIDRQLEKAYEELGGSFIDLDLVEQYTHPLLDLSSPLPPRPQLDASAPLAIQMFTTYSLPYCSFLTSQRIAHLFERFTLSPDTLSPDQTALVSSCLACGYVRLQSFGETGRTAQSVPEADRLDVAWYRTTVDVLDRLGSATFTSLHALSVMWFYSTMTCTSTATRFITSWMINQARELGIHRQQTASAIPYAPTDRADLMFFQVLYAHYHSTGTTSCPPMFRPGEFDTVIQPPFQPSKNDAPAALVPRRAFLELTLLSTRIHAELHAETTPALTVDWLLRNEIQWAHWMRAWVKDGRSTGVTFADPFVGILWDWNRLVVRAAVIEDFRFAVSCLSVLARSASQILTRYQDFYISQHYNLVWQHLRHIVTAAHVTLLCFWRFELTKREAEQSVSTAISILHLNEPRWGMQASGAREKIEAIALRFGLDLYPIAPQVEQHLDPSGWATNINNAGLLFTDTGDFSGPTFDYLFEVDS